MMKKLVIGILAHVDAGKTTLAESILYESGKIEKAGRVDNKDAYLDTNYLEKERGITIFSKQAVLNIDKTYITLLDTPGHVDFSAEMERTLQTLDYAILVISGADGVEGHTKTLWRLLGMYNIPVFLFINKMDQNRIDRDKLIGELKKQLDDGCIDFGQSQDDEFYEQLSMCDETIMESYLEKGKIEKIQIKRAIKEHKIFPCFFGSALKLQGVRELIDGIKQYTIIPNYEKQFAAKIFKITRDEQGNRLTHMKITGGKLKVKEVLSNGIWEDKVNQIRIYSGLKFQVVNEIDAGAICAVVGLNSAMAGEGIGIEADSNKPVLESVLFYRMILPEGCDPRVMLPKLRQLEEEDPQLHIAWNEQLKEIHVQLMGQVQIEILQRLIKERFAIDVGFDDGKIVYKETIENVVEGVGHFEPLKHYAEVHLLLEPGEIGSGLKFETSCSENILSKNWQRLIKTHLEEKSHKGVLTGSPITDMKITLVSGKAHNKHTEGGDFREATYRAVRQGLKEATSILLEPYYDFQLELPEKMVGRAMTDIQKMSGTSEISHTDGEMVVLVGSAPVVNMRNYQREVVAYTKGLGKLFCSLKGYDKCHNAEEVIRSMGYDSNRDVSNPTGSVFCSQGVSFLVEWHEVKEHMHVENYIKGEKSFQETNQSQANWQGERSISLEEIDRIINRTFYANQGKKAIWKRQIPPSEKNYEASHYVNIPKESNKEYLLVDAYNIIHAWPELKELIEGNMEGARTKLLEILSNYQAIRNCEIIVVFDAYRVEGHREEVIDYQNIHVVYTKEAQTADQYIERFTHENKKKYKIVVATSDGLQQIIVRGEGAYLLSARELKIEIEVAKERIRREYKKLNSSERHYLGDSLSLEIKEKMEALVEE